MRREELERISPFELLPCKAVATTNEVANCLVLSSLEGTDSLPIFKDAKCYEQTIGASNRH